MTKEIEKKEELSPEIIEQVVTGNIGKLTPDQRAKALLMLCERSGLEPLSQPFAIIDTKQGKKLYTTKNAASQIKENKKISVSMIYAGPYCAIKRVGKAENGEWLYEYGEPTRLDVHLEVVECRLEDGRTDYDKSVFHMGNNVGEALENGHKKVTTQAKRRAELSAGGMALLDESELVDVQEVKDGKPQIQAPKADPLPPRAAEVVIEGPAAENGNKAIHKKFPPAAPPVKVGGK